MYQAVYSIIENFVGTEINVSVLQACALGISLILAALPFYILYKIISNWF